MTTQPQGTKRDAQTGDELARQVGDALVLQDRHCRTYWGSHGCDLPRGHDFPLHMCGFGDGEGPHSFADTTGRVWAAEWMFADDDEESPPDALSDASAEPWKLFGEDVP